METTRQKKVSRLLQKELGDIFQKESRTYFDGAFITVTVVRVSPDLSSAKVYVSLFAVKNKEELLKKIKTHSRELRVKLAERIGKQVRVIPHLDYYIDDSLDYAEKIDNLLKK
jgi:ribosome-binding factor A